MKEILKIINTYITGCLLAAIVNVFWQNLAITMFIVFTIWCITKIYLYFLLKD